MTPTTRAQLEADYDRTADAYLAALTMEHFMEAVPQATQREITLLAFRLVRARRPDVHPFNELLVQYEHGEPPSRRYVVPDNVVVLHDGPVEAHKSYPVRLQPAGPFLVLEYVSTESRRKDYERSFRKYERELRVPYYLIHYPENDEMSLFRLGKSKYKTVVPDDRGRCPIPELEVEVGRIGGWIRFWFRGELLPHPDEVQGKFDEKDRQLAQEREENARLRAQLAALQAPRPPAP